jgi:hypothetical protein
MISFIKNLFRKKPDVMLTRKSPMYHGEREITLARSYRIGNRRFVDYGSYTLLLNGDGTVTGVSYLTHWEAL